VTDARVGYAPILDQLIELYPTMAMSGSFSPIRVGYRAVTRIGHGWFLRCQRGVEAILALDQMGYAEEAVGISRSVVEHGLALKWLAAEGDKIWDTLAFGHKHHAEKVLKATTDAGWTSIDPDELEVIASVQIETRDPANNYLLQFIERNKRYGDVHRLPGYGFPGGNWTTASISAPTVPDLVPVDAEQWPPTVRCAALRQHSAHRLQVSALRGDHAGV
jgi:hypothetical protein